jgi:HprK-related kinase A
LNARVSDLDLPALRRRLRGAGLRLRAGPVSIRLQSHVDSVANGVALHYAEYPLEPEDGFADFHIAVERPRGWRRWYRPQVVFRFDCDVPFAPLPGDQGFPMLEWGLNWCITSHCHQYLTLHAAIVERNGHALLLPAPPGSGKSTLCAGLTFSGWRLLSDELTILDPADGRAVPAPRPISLKNASIDVIKAFAPGAVFGPTVEETVKGRVAHARAPADAVRRAHERALPRWVVLPRYEAGAATQLTPLSKAQAVVRLVENAFNINVHGVRGFERLADLVDGCECFEFRYSRLDEAVTLFDSLAATRPLRESVTSG